ncbi:MAG: stage II sporulation protein R [Clostridia bacterium]|jgi:stage II sporulation protein R|nr:stage II sporulation protein R [Clostridia bacterium]
MKRFFVLLLLLTLFILVSALSYVNAVSSNIADSVFRLHVIANSDSEEDQALKLKVRDELLSYMNTLAKDCSSKEEVVALAKEHQAEFKAIAQKVISDNGFSYPVTIQIGDSDFPTKTYGDISLPAGTYDALRVQIGEAKGKNWWCVMFPPLCFVDVSTGIVPDDSKKEMQESLSDEEYDLISKTDNDEIHFKFKLIEFFQNLRLGQK